jgi:hypothetical protein
VGQATALVSRGNKTMYKEGSILRCNVTEWKSFQDQFTILRVDCISKDAAEPQVSVRKIE